MKAKHKKNQSSLARTVKQWPNSLAHNSNHRISHAIYKLEDQLMSLRIRLMDFAQSTSSDVKSFAESTSSDVKDFAQSTRSEAKIFSKRAKDQFSSI